MLTQTARPFIFLAHWCFVLQGRMFPKNLDLLAQFPAHAGILIPSHNTDDPILFSTYAPWAYKYTPDSYCFHSI